MKARFIEPIGVTLRVTLSSPSWEGQCPNEAWEGSRHYAVTEIECALDDPRIEAWRDLDAIPDDVLPKVCAGCGAPFKDTTWREFGAAPRYATASGRPEPGDLYWTPPYEQASNLGPAGPHLIGVLPSGESWDIDGPSHWDGKLGAGWTRTGEPPTVTVTPSIMTRQYHGWLQGGEWTPDLDGHTYP